MKVSLETVLQVVSSHVEKSNRSAIKIAADTPLFEEGLVDSFGMSSILAALEDATGQQLPEGALLPDDFESPRTLHTRLQEVG